MSQVIKQLVSACTVQTQSDWATPLMPLSSWDADQDNVVTAPMSPNQLPNGMQYDGRGAVLQVHPGHVGVGDIKVLVPETTAQKRNNRTNKAAQAVAFWETMAEYKISKGISTCNLWAMRDQLEGVVLSVPAKRLQKM